MLSFMARQEEFFDIVDDMTYDLLPVTALAGSGTFVLVLHASRSDGYAWRSKTAPNRTCASNGRAGTSRPSVTPARIPG